MDISPGLRALIKKLHNYAIGNRHPSRVKHTQHIEPSLIDPLDTPQPTRIIRP